MNMYIFIYFAAQWSCQLFSFSFVSIAVKGLSSQDTQLFTFISAPNDKGIRSMDEKSCM